MNLSKELKKKRDAEERLRKSSPTPTYQNNGTSETYIDLSALALKSEIIDEIVELNDVDITFTGNAGKVLKVNDAGTGIDLGDASSGGGGAFAFEIGVDGHLYVLYDDGSTAPDFEINVDGHLILDLGAVI